MRELQRQSMRYEPCLPRLAKAPPAGPGWIHEIKHDGFRILAERRAKGVNLHTRRGYDFADRFPRVVAAIVRLPARSCVIDGEAIACDANGLAVFDLLRRRWHGDEVMLCAFDLLELDGQDMRRAPLEERKAALAKLLHRTSGGIVYNEHYEADGAIIYKYACALGMRGTRRDLRHQESESELGGDLAALTDPGELPAGWNRSRLRQKRRYELQRPGKQSGYQRLPAH